MKWDRPVPRYTSYPTAPQFVAIGEDVARARYAAFDHTDRPLSLYIHIPFCRSMCLYCACSVILNRKPEKQSAYLALLIKEIELVAQCFRSRRSVAQLHLGGGTPTSLSEVEFEELMQSLRHYFHFESNAEISIEIDPRTVFDDQGKKLRALRQLGFNRVSFGVQDLDPAVQEAVRRRQSREMTIQTLLLARQLQFDGINVDLIYGLPLQKAETFRQTVETLMQVKPDRIALFSYAKVPWLKQHQKAIREEDLPSAEEKLRIYTEAREEFLRSGYTAIGMDHFALQDDSIARAYREGQLYRNFQGYSVAKAEDLIGLGVTSVGFVEGAFLQNVKTIEEYEARLAQNMLPICRGFELKAEDLLRRWVIQRWMCCFLIDRAEFLQLFGKSFDQHFANEQQAMEDLIKEGLLLDDGQVLRATEQGRIFIRLIANAFDEYKQGLFSSAV